MEKYVCGICGYVYDPANPEPEQPGGAFADLPASWTCPLCGATKDDFSAE